MGLFDKLFKSKESKKNLELNNAKIVEPKVEDIVFEEDYRQLKEVAKRIINNDIFYVRRTDNAEEVVSDCEEFIKIAENIDNPKTVKRILSESSGDYYGHPSHEVFGIQNHGEKELDELIRTAKRLKEVYGKLVIFNKKRDDLVYCDIEITDTVLKRNSVMDMPEIKYTNVTKSFNKDKLPSFVVIDTETTGLRASSGRIVQLSAIRYVEWEPSEIWTSYINPKKKMPNEATEINGITDEMLKDKPIIGNISESFLGFVGNSPIVGYNLPFDLKFLFAEGIDLFDEKRKYYDVLPIARRVYKEDLDNFTLENVANNEDIYYNAHNSIEDCLATGGVFCKIVDRITE